MIKYLNLTLRNSIRNLKFEIRNSRTRSFTLIELIVSVALLLVALSIALFAVVGTNGMIQKADARSSISESTRGVGEAIRRTIANAPVGAVSLLAPNAGGTTYAVIQVKAFSDLQSGNTCTVIGRATATTDSTGEEKYTINKDGTVIAILIYNVDSGGLCPTTGPIYQNRLTNVQAVVKAAQFSIQNIACTTITTSCVTKQLLRYSLTLEMAQKGSGGTSEARQPTLTIQEGLPIGLVNEATTVLKIETTSLPDANARGQYTANVIASGGMPPYKLWSMINGSWSPGPSPGGQGFSIDANTGVITAGSLNSQAAGQTYNFTVQVTDSNNPANSTTRALSIKVLDNLITITSTSPLPVATEGSNYNVQLAATIKLNNGNCGSCIWSIAPGGLPAGMTLDSIGKISGNPNPGTAASSPYTLVITATESGAPTNYTTKTFSLTVSGTPQPLTITTLSLPGGTVSTPYSTTIQGSGGTGPYSWSKVSGSWPPGNPVFTINAGTGAVTGTPTAAGTYSSIRIRLTDALNNFVEKDFTIIIGGGGGLEPG